MKTQNLTPEEKAQFMERLVNEFRDFVKDSIMDGMAEDWEDHHEFLRSALETFIDLKESMEEEADTHNRKWSQRLSCWLYRATINGKEAWVTIPEDEQK